MEKDFDQMNYYEILDVKPNASAAEIRGAYNEALQIYQPDSLVSYSFFSREERNKILSLLEKAYLTLVNEVQRERYDTETNLKGSSGSAEKDAIIKKEPMNIFEINRQAFNSVARKNHTAELKTKISQSQLIKEILSRQEIKGADLKAIRNELGVDIETIHKETKIRLECLICIEADDRGKLPAGVYLKGFVKAYLKSLCIESADVISALYISSITTQKLT